jgi:hypothetical protein
MINENKFLITAALLQVILLGVLVTIEHPHLTMQSLIGAALLLAAEFVVYREVRNMKESAPQPQRVHIGLVDIKRRPGRK